VRSMASANTVLLVGTDIPLLEGLSQTLSAMGFVPAHAATLADAIEHASGNPPTMLVVDRDLATGGMELLRIPLARGGALVLYRTEGQPAAVLPAATQRAVLADLRLPLERARLVALLQYITERTRTTGRDIASPPDPEVRREP
jgi:DNA-binding NtrC family response regulator